MICSVIGLGKLGLPIAKVFSRHYKVIGIDKIKTKGYTTSYTDLGDITFVVVPTPSDSYNRFSSQYVEEVLNKIHKKQIIVIVSTLMPGETDRLQKKYKHLTLIYNPTFVALGTVAYDFTHPDIILIGGKDRRIIFTLLDIYSVVLKSFPYFALLTPLEAEIVKLALNCYITTKITFANQIGNLCYSLDINPDNILNAIGKDSRIGNKYFKAGLGYGGPCFPRDNLAMAEFMQDNGLYPQLNETVHNLNKRQIAEMVYRIERLNPKSIGFESLSYKKGSDVTEHSQLKAIWEKLKEDGYKVKMGKGEINIDWEGIK